MDKAFHPVYSTAMNAPKYDFASDNAAPLCPAALSVLAKANEGTAPSYGADRYATEAAAAINELLGEDRPVHFVSTGTAGNCLALAAMLKPHGAVACHPMAHIATDEAGAPHFFAHGASLAFVQGDEAKIDPDALERLCAAERIPIHEPKLEAVSLSQTTELGSLYELDELRAISSIAKARGLRIHLDGARIANASAALGCDLKDIIEALDPAALVFGGSKNGITLSEAIVLRDSALEEDFSYRIKQSGHLVSKARYLAAPWAALIRDGTWLKNAQHANDMANFLAHELMNLGFELACEAQANAVFVKLPQDIRNGLLERGWAFYQMWKPGVYRLMCSWATKPETVRAFVDDALDCMR